MRARAVGRAGRVDDREPLGIPKRLEGLERRMQTEVAIKVDRRLGAAIRFRNRDVRAQIVVAVLAVRYDYVQTINGAALKDGDQRLPLAAGNLVNGFGQRAPEKGRRRRRQTKRSERDAAGFDEIPSVHARTS